MGDKRAGVRQDVPAAGQHTREILTDILGLETEAIAALMRDGAVA